MILHSQLKWGKQIRSVYNKSSVWRLLDIFFSISMMRSDSKSRRVFENGMTFEFMCMVGAFNA